MDPAPARTMRSVGATWRRLPTSGRAAVFVAAVLAAYTFGASGGGGASSRAGASSGATPPAASPLASAPVRRSQSAPSTAKPSGPATPTLGSAPIGRVQEARVVRIVDGDTIVIDRGRGNEKLRYIGMDTPETVDPGSPVEWMGPQASKANSALVGGQTVWLEKDVSEVDRYGRLLRDVWLRDATRPNGWLFVNLELVARGYAQVTTFPPDVRYVDALLDAQRMARESGLGLWGPAPSAGSSPIGLVGPARTSAPAGSCSPSYSPCLPIVDDLDCPDVRAMGKAPVKVIGPDVYRLDRDGDGIGCD